MLKKILLTCGILSSLYYTIINIFVPAKFEGYSQTSQTVSELSAIGAPTRTLWVILAAFYVLLFAAFGIGVLKSAGKNRSLRIAGIFTLIYTIINLYWPPMHLRENEPALTDTLHITWAIVTLILMMLIMIFGAKGLEKQFRIYTFVTFVIFVTFGILIGIEAPGIAENTPTPYIGLWERINIGAFMLWIIVFAVTLLKRESKSVQKKY